jgi:hypothetical protein
MVVVGVVIQMGLGLDRGHQVCRLISPCVVALVFICLIADTADADHHVEASAAAFFVIL